MAVRFIACFFSALDLGKSVLTVYISPFLFHPTHPHKAARTIAQCRECPREGIGLHDCSVLSSVLWRFVGIQVFDVIFG